MFGKGRKVTNKVACSCITSSLFTALPTLPRRRDEGDDTGDLPIGGSVAGNGGGLSCSISRPDIVDAMLCFLISKSIIKQSILFYRFLNTNNKYIFDVAWRCDVTVPR